MTKSKLEERYPLLLLYVEENGRKSEFPQRVVFADKARGKEVTKGAAAILTLWPAQVTSCWLTSVAFGTAFIFISLVLLLSSLNTVLFPIHPRCTRDIHDQIGNKTIHLVKHGSIWNHKQVDILQFIADTYPKYEIRIIMLDSSFEHSKKREKKKHVQSTTEKIQYHSLHMPNFANIFKNINEISRSNLIIDNKPTKENISGETPVNHNNIRMKRNVVLFKLPNSYDDILNNYSNIREEKITYKQYFTSTPLHYFWPDYSTEMLLFSVRVLELWQNGGITFYLPNYEHGHDHKRNTSKHIKTVGNITVNTSQLKKIISNTKYRYEKLADNLVCIDEQGYRMSTKIPCHSFFGEMIIKLQKDVTNLTVSNFIQRILHVFCGRGAVDSEYCMKNEFLS